MNPRAVLLALALALAAAAGAGAGLRTAPAADPPAPGRTSQIVGPHTFTLPEGFLVEQVAGPPLVNRPIVADFDEQGRLYVADSSGSNDPVARQLETRPHRIVRLEDADGDGKFDRATVFADRMMFPEGVLWLDSSLYVAAPPSIWKLTDTDGDGVADRREEWFQGRTLTGCANDLHGPYAGPDGRIYWCKGAFARQTYERPGRPPLVTRASHIFRAKPDGTAIEPVMTGGMDNPVDVAFTPDGERIFTTTFLQHPGGGKRDGLIHAIHGGIYGKVHDVLDDHPWTAPEVMPVLTHLGAAAPAGLHRYESDAFGPAYRDSLFACLFNMRKVTRHVLEPDGASFRTRDEDFLVSDNLDFHPTDVIEDADGSLLVVNTGGWYKLCCPTSQLAKPDVLGAIYRVRRAGAPTTEDPRGTKLAWATLKMNELGRLLGDPRPTVRRRATTTLARQGADALPVLRELLRSGPTPESRRNAVWTATRIDHAEARALVREALADTDATVRQAALNSVSLYRDREAAPALVKVLQGAASPNRRTAAEALGRIGDPSAIPALLYAAESRADRPLAHALTYALIEIGDRDKTAAGLTSPSPAARRIALIALDQMGGGALPAGPVVASLNAADPALREAATWIAGRHPEWGQQLAGALAGRLAAPGLPPSEREELGRQLARLSGSAAIQQVLASALGKREPSGTTQVALRAMAASGLRELPASWQKALDALLAGDDPAQVSEAVAVARAVPPAKDRAAGLGVSLRQAAARESLPAEVRLAALAAVPGGLAETPAPLFDFLRSRLGPGEPVGTRLLAAEVLGKSGLSADQLADLTASLRDLGPIEVDRLLDAFARSGDERVGLKLLKTLGDPKVRAGLRAETLRPRLAKYGPGVQPAASALFAALEADTAGQRTRLEQLAAALAGGDVRRGQAVFHGSKAVCATCHAIGYLGGTVGPDLTHIGKIRTERDLLESIVFPSASFVRSYEPVEVTLKSGKAINGLVRRETPGEIILATGPNQEVRLARAEVEEVHPGRVSVMPAGLDQQLTPGELADLVAFLKACQ